MRIKFFAILALLSYSVANAQSVVIEVFKTIVPAIERAYLIVTAYYMCPKM